MSATYDHAATGEAPILVDRAAAAKLLGISTRTLDRLLSRGVFPKPDLKIGKKLRRWRRASLEAWTLGQDD